MRRSVGVAWAIVFARAGHDVALYDPDPKRLNAAPRELRGLLDDLTSFELLDEPPAAVASRVEPTADLAAALAGAAYVQPSSSPSSTETRERTPCSPRRRR